MHILYIGSETRETQRLARSLEAINGSFHLTIKETRRALELIEVSSVDCVICRHDQHDIPVDELTERIRNADSTVPVICLTEFDEEVIESEDMAIETDDVFHLGNIEEGANELAKHIENVVDRRRSGDRDAANITNGSALFENTPDPIVEVRFEGKSPIIEDVNAAFSDVFGYEKEAVIGQSVTSTIVPDPVRDVHLSFRDQVFEGTSVESTVRRKTVDGIRVFNVRIIPITDEKGVSGAYAWYTDLTEQRRYQQRLESLNEANRRLMTATSETAVADIALDLLTETIDHPRAEVWSYDAPTESLYLIRTSDRESESANSTDNDEQPSPISAGEFEMDVFQKGEAVFVDTYESVENPAYTDRPWESVLIAPLADFGQLHVGFGPGERSDAATREHISILCQNMEAALERVHRERILSRLNEITTDLVQSDSPAEIAQLTADAGNKILGLPYTHVYLVDKQSDVLKPVAVADETRAEFGEMPEFERGEGLLWKVFESSEPHLYDDVQSEAALASNMPFRGAVIAPLGKHGVFASGSMEAAEFDTFDSKVASILADTAEVALDRAEREKRLREHESELTEALDRFQSVFEHSNDAIMIIDPQTDEILEANPRASEMLGYSRGELLNMAPSDIHPEDMSKFRDFIDEIQTKGTGRTERLTCVTASGEQLPTEMSASTLEFEGRDSILALMRDVSEIREYQQELERQNERLDEFAALLSHDLRNPLNVALGRIELAREGAENEHLDSALSSLERMEEMIEDLLTLAREGGSVEEMDVVELETLIDGCWQNVDTPNATLISETTKEIRADRTRLRHVFENLFRNSIEQADGTVTITVGDLPDTEGIFIEDTGPGIPPEERETVFEQGYTTTEEGTGYGLSIVREIVNGHGWEICVTDSSPGGARFEITGLKDSS